MRVGIQVVRPVRKSLLSWLRASTRVNGLRERSTHTPGLIHRPLFALCNRSKSPPTRLITTQNRNSVPLIHIRCASHYLGGVVGSVSEFYN